MIIYEDMSQRSLWEFFSPASTSGNGSEDDSESEEEEELQHAPSNSKDDLTATNVIVIA